MVRVGLSTDSHISNKPPWQPCSQLIATTNAYRKTNPHRIGSACRSDFISKTNITPCDRPAGRRSYRKQHNPMRYGSSQRRMRRAKTTSWDYPLEVDRPGNWKPSHRFCQFYPSLALFVTRGVANRVSKGLHNARDPRIGRNDS